MVKSLPEMLETRFIPWVRRIPWRKKWQPKSVILLGKPRGQKSLVGYSPQGHKESDTTERLRFTSLHFERKRCVKDESKNFGLSNTLEEQNYHQLNWERVWRETPEVWVWECYLWVNTDFAQISAHYILHFYKSKWQEIKPIYFFTQISGKLTEPVWIHTSRTWKKNMVKKSESHSVVSDSWIL